ncbi:hypothetical protein IQ264_09165 [Phormidium sp. LEGE 05292]|nr:hypothetical protein [Phormidium sp. LEGE 05292]
MIEPQNRLILSSIITFLTYWLLPLPFVYKDIRLITTYVVGVAIDLGLIILMMVISTAEATMRRSAQQEPSNKALLGFIVLLYMFLASLVWS